MEGMGPNGSAYEKEEIRVGAPLSYVAEKLRHALLCSHRANRRVAELVPNNLPKPEPWSGPDLSVRDELILSQTQSAFHYSLTAYLALINALGVINDPKKIQALSRLGSADLEDWLSRIERESSITGD